MGQREDARAEELQNLRLALATFALQLDAFEMRASGALRAAGRERSIRAPTITVREPAITVLRPNRLRDSNGGDDWASKRSAGNKSGT